VISCFAFCPALSDAQPQIIAAAVRSEQQIRQWFFVMAIVESGQFQIVSEQSQEK
jgi:hypothetical protein